MTVEEKKTIKRIQSVFIENRKKIIVTGVTDVISFNEEGVVMLTDLGELTVYGRKLHIGKLNLENGELEITGDLSCCEYTGREDGKEKKGLFGRLF